MQLIQLNSKDSIKTEKQKCIEIHYDNINKMQLMFNCDIEKLNNTDKEYLRYKFACAASHTNCNKIDNNKNLAQFKACQIHCHYSYEYN